MQILKTIGSIIGVVLLMAAFVLVIKTSVEREGQRQDAVRVYNCKHYGKAINDYAGKEVCPPTPHG